MAADPLFLDTSLLVAAAVDVHPAHQSAHAYVERVAFEQIPLCISAQILREMFVVLTRKPIGGRTYTVDEALTEVQALREGCTTLAETAAVAEEWNRLIRKYAVRGKQAHDCNIVAVMVANGIRRLATRNAQDFERYAAEIDIEPIDS